MRVHPHSLTHPLGIDRLDGSPIKESPGAGGKKRQSRPMVVEPKKIKRYRPIRIAMYMVFHESRQYFLNHGNMLIYYTESDLSHSGDSPLHRREERFYKHEPSRTRLSLRELRCIEHHSRAWHPTTAITAASRASLFLSDCQCTGIYLNHPRYCILEPVSVSGC